MWGIPIAHKDLFETRGVRTTAGSLLYDDYIPDDNAAIVQQLEHAGAVLLGKTNTHELGGGVTTINPFLRDDAQSGRSDAHPRRIERRIGGGRRRASLRGGNRQRHRRQRPHSRCVCGCVGFKPTFGRISTQGLLGACPTFDHVGFLTRTVEDAQIIVRRTRQRHRRCITRASPSRASYFFDDLEPAVASVKRIARRREVSATSTFPIDVEDDGARLRSDRQLRDLEPVRRRLAHQPRIVLERLRRLLLDAAAVDRRVRIRARRAQGISGRRRQALRLASTSSSRRPCR